MKIFKDWTFHWWEVSLIKLCLISLGILLGLYFHDLLIGLTTLWWVVFAVSAAYLLGRFFKEG